MPDWLTAPAAAVLAAAAAVGVVAFGGTKELVTAWFGRRRERAERDHAEERAAAARRQARLDRQAKEEEEESARRRRAAKDREIEGRYGDGFGRMLEYHQSFTDLQSVTAASRVLILRGFNGGGLPRPGEKYHVRAEEAWSRDPTKDVSSRYNFDLPVDATYTDMLREVVTKGAVVLTTAAMPESILRGFYEDEGVVQAMVFRLHLNESRLLFISVASYEAEFTKRQQADIGRRVMRMAAMIEAAEGGCIGTGTDMHAAVQ